MRLPARKNPEVCCCQTFTWRLLEQLGNPSNTNHVRLSRTGLGALIASVVVHSTLIVLGARLLSNRYSVEEVELPVELSVETFRGPGTDNLGVGTSPARPVQVPESLPEAPVPGGAHTPRPDSGKPGRGGSRTGERASNLSSSIDPLTLERDTPNQLRLSEVQRLRVARVRRTRDDRRATPNPMELDFVATGRGWHAIRRPSARTSPSQGTEAGGVPLLAGTSPGGDPGELPVLKPGSEVLGGEQRQAQGANTPAGRDFRLAAAVATVRPSVVRDRASVPAPERGRTSDTVDSRQKVTARFDALMQASTLGGNAPAGVGGETAPRAPALGGGQGAGARSAPSGVGSGNAPDLASDPSLQGFYHGVLSRLGGALRGAFPNWAIAEGLGGLVVFDLTLLEDGRVAQVSVVRPSGVAEYDRNVVAGVRRIPSFGRVPSELGRRAVLRINWDSINPVVGRNGRGPGGRPAP